MGSERELREQLAAMTRILVNEGVLNYSGHVSARLPEGDLFLIQPRDSARGQLEPDDLLVVDFDGQLVRGDVSVGGPPPRELYIHSEIYRVRDDVDSVLHSHHEPSTLLTLIEGVEFVLLKNHSVRWVDGVPVHPDPGHINSQERGADMAKTLGSCHAMSLRAHGQVVTAEDPRALLVDAMHFVENAQAVLEASAIGTPIPLTAEEIEQCLTDFRPEREKHVFKLWQYYVGQAHQEGLIGSVPE